MTANEAIQRLKQGIPDDPLTCTDIETTLAVHLHEWDEEFFLAEQEEAKKWEELRATSLSDKHTDMRIKQTEEWMHKKRVEARRKGMLETIRSLRRRVKALSEQFQIS